MNYAGWNKLIGQRFFNPGMAGRSVYLCVTEDVINDIGQQEGVGVNDFIEAVIQDAGGSQAPMLCCRALKWLSLNMTKGEYPGYLGYLALFVLAATKTGENGFPSHAYYPYLKRLIGQPECPGMPDGFNKMRDLWAHLESWSCGEMQGEWGQYQLVQAGCRSHVDIPIAQALLSDRDRRVLPAIFARANLNPLFLPLADTLLAALREWGPYIDPSLLPRTLRLLNGPETPAQRILLSLILEELRNWDGCPGPSSPSTAKRVFVCLRLCFTIDRIARQCWFALRCATNREFPEEGLRLVRAGQHASLYAEYANAGWSEPICDTRSGIQVDATKLDWSTDIQLREQDYERAIIFRGHPIHVFVASGEVAGMVETPYLPRDVPFWLVAKREYRDRLESWGSRGCKSFCHLPDMKGIPDGWDLFKANKILDDSEIRNIAPWMAFNAVTRVTFYGGFRSVPRREHYYVFAPPRIMIEGWDQTVSVRCEGRPLAQADVLGEYTIPLAACKPGRLSIEAWKRNEMVHRRWIYLCLPSPGAPVIPVKWFDAFRTPILDVDNHKACIAGALVRNIRLPSACAFPNMDQLVSRYKWLAAATASALRDNPSSAIPLPPDVRACLQHFQRQEEYPHLPRVMQIPRSLMPYFRAFSAEVACHESCSENESDLYLDDSEELI